MHRLISLATPLRIFRILVYSLLTLHSSLGADDPELIPEPEELTPYQASIERITPMDTEGLDSGLASVLRNYYQRNFISEENWALVESLRFDGILQLPQGELRFTAFKKKPDLCKIVIYARNRGRVVMSYDGKDAWQLNTAQSDNAEAVQPTDMPTDEALNFIRDATTGGHLLYPRIAGKKMELLGTTSFDGVRTYQILVTLPDGDQIRSYLDINTFAEVRQITINHVTGYEELTIHSDFRQIDGINVPFLSTLTIDGKQIHQTRIDRVQFGVGLTAWMFSRPSLDTASATTESPVAIPSSPPAHNTNADQLLPVQPGSLFQIEQPKSFFEVNPLSE
jgi:DNA-binding NarL/FixJ family response regulator